VPIPSWEVHHRGGVRERRYAPVIPPPQPELVPIISLCCICSKSAAKFLSRVVTFDRSVPRCAGFASPTALRVCDTNEAIFRSPLGVGKCVPTCYARCYSPPTPISPSEAAKKSADALDLISGLPLMAAAPENGRKDSRVGRRRPRPHHRLRLPRGVNSTSINYIVSRSS
jgi:hypothetical protein